MGDLDKNSAKIIALCGKGGVGKTSLSAAMVKIFMERPENRVLAVDADPAVGLSTSLGITIRKTVDDIRNDLIGRVQGDKSGSKEDVILQLDYEMFSALEEKDNLALLAIGRPEKEGCYCQINRILKDIIASMSYNFNYVIIDGEAGIEQVNRRVMEKVTHLILVSDASARGLNVAQSLKKISDAAIDYDKVGLIVNRLHSEQEAAGLLIPPELNCLGWIPEDDTIRTFDIEGKSILEIPDCPAVRASKDCLAEIGLLE